jgi:hypothetical protein
MSLQTHHSLRFVSPQPQSSLDASSLPLQCPLPDSHLVSLIVFLFGVPISDSSLQQLSHPLTAFSRPLGRRPPTPTPTILSSQRNLEPKQRTLRPFADHPNQCQQDVRRPSGRVTVGEQCWAGHGRSAEAVLSYFISLFFQLVFGLIKPIACFRFRLH